MPLPDRLAAALTDRSRIEPEHAAVLGTERFAVEIKTTAALSHPHILPLFDSGEAGRFPYGVMPHSERGDPP